MSILPRNNDPVHSDPFAGCLPCDPFPFPAPGLDMDDFGPDPADEQWWAELMAGDPPTPPDLCSDAAWFLDAARDHERMGRGRLDTSVHGLIAGAFRDVARSLRFHRHETVRQHLADPHVLAGPDDLDAVKLPSAMSHSPLAEELRTQASWYLHLDTDAATLGAWHLLYIAAQADEFGSLNAREYRDSEAAFREALMQACAEAGEEW